MTITWADAKSSVLHDEDGTRNPHAEVKFEKRAGNRWYEVYAECGPTRKGGTRKIGRVTGAGYYEMEGSRTVGEFHLVDPGSISVEQ